MSYYIILAQSKTSPLDKVPVWVDDSGKFRRSLHPTKYQYWVFAAVVLVWVFFTWRKYKFSIKKI